MAWGGKGSDTRELLREVNSEARESYYKASSSKPWFYAVGILAFIGLALLGLWIGMPSGYVFVVSGILGLVVVCILLGLRL